MDHFRQFGCRCTVFRGKELISHRKLAPRGLACVYVGTGMSFGRKCFLAYSPVEHKVYATVDCQFDETYFPYCPVGTRRDYGIHDSHNHDYVLHPDCDPTDEHLIDSIRNVPIQSASWNPTEILTDSFDRDFHDAMQQATAHLYSGDDAQPDTPSAGKYPHNSSLNL